VIFKKKARTLGKKSIGYPVDLEIYGKSTAKPMDFSCFVISISASAGK